MSPRRRTSKYEPVLAYLRALPATQMSTELTLTEIAALIGQPLPISAHSAGFWAGHFEQYFWRPAGYVARWKPRRGVVLFTRIPAP
jgi:hypothetical protein